MRRRLLPLAVLALLAVPAVVLADPGNDERADAQRILRLPATVQGTVQDAGVAGDEPPTECGEVAASVFYRLDAGRSRRLVLRLQAEGDLDGVLDVYERDRSSLQPVTCEQTDGRGNAAVGVDVEAGHSYLVRVGRRPGAAAAGFTLTAAAAEGGPRLPGRPLPAGGVAGTLDRLGRTGDAFSVRLQAGTRYRVALAHGPGACVRARVLPAGSELGEPGLVRLGCAGYGLLTPRRTGRYSVVVDADRAHRGPQGYRLRVAPGGQDDSAPGRHLDNYRRVRGALDGGQVDRLDLYAFDVERASSLFLRLATGARRRVDLGLYDQAGHELGCTCGGEGPAELTKGLGRGRYFAAVRARDRSAGAYTLLRAQRTITATTQAVSAEKVPLGSPVSLSATVSPAVTGPVTFALEQRDPFAGWQYVRDVRAQAVAGVAQVAFVAPTEGRWRVRATYRGTRGSARSHAGLTAFSVLPPPEADLGF